MNEQEKQRKQKAHQDKTAVALSYEPGDQAPKILASGKGYVAEKIMETAREHDVPLYQDSSLAATLAKLEIGECIPPALYDIVAEILVFVDKADRLREKVGRSRK